jgi:hypothetical protein
MSAGRTVRVAAVRLAVGVITSLALLTAAAASAEAVYKPKSYIARYCSPTGDLCYGIFRQARLDRIVFQITTQERYFRSYRMCVQAPTDARKCRNFPLNPQTPVYGSHIYWRRYFGDHGPGLYRVTLSFRRR